MPVRGYISAATATSDLSRVVVTSYPTDFDVNAVTDLFNSRTGKRTSKPLTGWRISATAGDVVALADHERAARAMQLGLGIWSRAPAESDGAVGQVAVVVGGVVDPLVVVVAQGGGVGEVGLPASGPGLSVV